MWSLMSDEAITPSDRKAMASFCLLSERFTASKCVREFETKWSEWQGCKHSVFVNSGSSANLILVDALRSKYGSGMWVAQACTWSTNVSPICQLGMPLQLCDIDLNNFGPDLDNLEHIFKRQKPKFLFLTHLIGFPAITDRLLSLCKQYNVVLAEDCCESPGAKYKDMKVGNFGVASTFSFYYGHHITTIEGGMVCTNDDEVYHTLLLLRAHGLLRELPKEERKKREVEGVDPAFTFLLRGYNVRSTEMNAVLGCRQVDRLDDIIVHRNKNLMTFLSALNSTRYKTNFVTEGVSSFCLPLYCYGDKRKAQHVADEMKIEHRPMIAGNLHKHDLLMDVNQFRYEENVNMVHSHCLYVGNHQDVTTDNIVSFCDHLNKRCYP